MVDVRIIAQQPAHDGHAGLRIVILLSCADLPGLGVSFAFIRSIAFHRVLLRPIAERRHSCYTLRIRTFV